MYSVASHFCNFYQINFCGSSPNTARITAGPIKYKISENQIPCLILSPIFSYIEEAINLTQGSEMNCSIERSSTAYEKHRSSLKTGGNTTTQRDQQCIRVSTASTRSHNSYGTEAHYALAFKLDQLDEADQVL